jgi:hypothetical protein
MIMTNELMMMDALRSSETSGLTRARLHNITADGILQVQRNTENNKKVQQVRSVDIAVVKANTIFWSS